MSTPNTTPLTAEQITAQTAAKLAQQTLELLYVERREDILTILAYRLHQARHQATVPVDQRPSWGESQKLAADTFDEALEALTHVILQAESTPAAAAAAPAAETPVPAEEHHQE